MKHGMQLIWAILTIATLLALAPAAQGATTALEWGAAETGVNRASLLADNPLIWRDDFDGSWLPEWTMVNENE